MKILFLLQVVIVPMILGSSSFAQSLPRFTCTNRTPQTESELKEWIRSDVRWIATETEITLFSKLESVAKRQDFIKRFWERRDPDPSTAENEFRDTYCSRLSQTGPFQSGIPGWKTDRGRTLVLWGKPDDIRRGRTDVEGIAGVPFERWSYKHIDGLGGDVVLTFVDPTETDEYRLSKEDLKRLSECFGMTPTGLSTRIGFSQLCDSKPE